MARRIGAPVDNTESPIPFAIACAAGQFLLTILILKFGFSFAPPEAYGKVKLLAFASTIVYPLLLSLPAWRGIVLNGLLFGAMHLIHGFMDTDWQTACWKMLVTSIAGMMFTAVRYRSGSLWLCVILHMALNLCMIYSKVQRAAESTVFLVERAANLIEIAVAA